MVGLDITLFGHFRIVDTNGRDLTPAGEKPKAFMALLVTGTGHRRTRTWVQDKLWSASDPERGAASLRQCLMTIRKTLGAHADIVQADRGSLWLDPARFETDWSPERTDHRAEFLEGINVEDDEFDHWLQQMRGAAEPGAVAPAPRCAATPARPRRVLLRGSRADASPLQHFEQQMINLIARNIAEYGAFSVAVDDMPNGETADISYVLEANDLSEHGYALNATVRDAATQHVLWSELERVKDPFAPFKENMSLLALAFRLQSVLTTRVKPRAPSGGRAPDHLGTLLPDVFSFDEKTVHAADRALQDTGDRPDNALALGLRSQIAVIRLIEKFDGCADATVEEGLACAERAIERDPLNSMVLATASNAHALLADNEIAAAELASIAVNVNPSNPFGWWAYSNAALYSEDYDKALRAAQLGARLSTKSSLRFWFEAQVGLAALMLGDHERAKRSLETSAALSPKFRPPRRYLIALYAANGDIARARRVVQKMQDLEPGFSADELYRNAEYPVSLARRAGLMRTDFSAELR